MTIKQMQMELQGSSFVSPSLGGDFESFNGLFLLNGVQFQPTEQQIKALHSDYMVSDLAKLNDFDSNYFYEL